MDFKLSDDRNENGQPFNSSFNDSQTSNKNYDTIHNESSDFDNNWGKKYNFFKKKKKGKKDFTTSSNPIFLTKKKVVGILLLVLIVAFCGAFGGFYIYDKVYPTGSSNKKGGSITGDGYTLAGATGSPKTVNEIVEENLETVVQIRTESVSAQDIWLGEYVSEGAGSGVIIKSDGYIITNNHVIEGASKIYVTLSNNKEYEAELIGTDPESDIAVLKIDASGLKAATYGNSNDLTIGDLSVIVGNPLGELGGTVTAGIISSLDREITIGGQPMTLLQTDASVNPGNSGGAMFDQYGHLVGIVVAKSSGSDVEGLGFAIPINKAADIAAQLMENGSVKSTTAYSGMTYVQDQGGGVFIQEVNEDFAKKSGFQPGDQVLAIEDTIIEDIDTLSATIKSHKAGDTVIYTIARQGRQLQIKIKLETKN